MAGWSPPPRGRIDLDEANELGVEGRRDGDSADAQSYRAELDCSIEAATSGEQPAEAASAADGRRAMVLAETAVESMSTGRPVEVPR